MGSFKGKFSSGFCSIDSIDDILSLVDFCDSKASSFVSVGVSTYKKNYKNGRNEIK